MMMKNNVNSDYRDRAKAILKQLLFLYPGDSTYQMLGINPRKKSARVCKNNLVIDNEGVVSGYFKESNPALKHALELDENMLPDGVFLLLNPCNDVLLEKADHCLQANVERVKNTDIPHICNILVDVNPIKPDGVSSTDEELENAIQMAMKIKGNSMENGWPEPLVGDSGNSAQLIFKANLANTQESQELIHRVLQVLHTCYGNDKVAIDTTVSNAGALVRMFGTLARKGDNVPNRPHRLSKIISIPDPPQIVSLDLLRSFIGNGGPTTELESSSSSERKIDAQIISGEELLKMDFEENPDIIEKLAIEKQVTVFLGDSNAGKSLYALNIALSVGSPMIENICALKINRHVPTLFVQSESTSKAMKDRILLMFQGNLGLRQGVKNIHFVSTIQNDVRVTGHNLSDQRFVDFMIENILKTGAKLVIFDPLASVLQNNSRRGLDNVNAICDQTNSACIAIHHENSANLQNSDFTGRIGYWADTVFRMEQSRNVAGAVTMRCKKARHFQKPGPTELKINANLLFEEAKDHKQKVSLKSNIVVHALETLGGSVAKQADLSTELVANTGKSISTVRNIITDAVRAGQITVMVNPKNKRERGYQIVPQPTIP